MTKEITLEEVRAAYAKFPHLKPIQGGFRRPFAGPTEECCPLGILAAAAGKNLDDENFSVKDWAFCIYGEYANDFWKGVDNRSSVEAGYTQNPGWKRGREIAIALGLR